MIVYLALLVGVVLLVRGKELFTPVTNNFYRLDNAEFRGINLLGVNSDDGHFACQSPDTCQQVCQRNPECAGYSFYAPGQRCYMFSTGDFVPGRPGFISGKKIE